MISSSDMSRILVVGDTGVGKTLFLRRLRYMTLRDRSIFLSSWGPTVGFCVEVILVDHSRSALCNAKKTIDTSYVAFIELGGNRNFGSSTQLPINLMSFDGVIFVYDRHNASSASGLSYWYETLKSYGIVGGGASAKIMLLEVVLNSSKSTSSDHSHRPPDELLDVYLKETVRSVPVWERCLQRMQAAGTLWLNMWKPSLHDFQNRQGGFRLYVVLFLFHYVSMVENALLFLMAVALFGPSQKSVSFRISSVNEALSTIRNDAGGTHVLGACPLYDQVEFEGLAVEEVMSFVSSLRSV